MSNINEYELWQVEPIRTPDAEKRYANLSIHGGHSLKHDDFEYKKVKHLRTMRMHEKSANDFNEHSHNSKERWFMVSETEIDHEVKQEMNLEQESKAGNELGA